MDGFNNDENKNVNTDNFVDASVLDEQPAPAPEPQPAPAAPQPTFDSGVNYGAAPNTTVYNTVYAQPTAEEPYPIGKWIGILFLSMIPCVNIIMLFVWAFSEGNTSRKNYAKAKLIVAAICIVLYVLFMILFGTAFASILSEMSNYYY